ncbi:MAG: hypothetical protein IJB26_03255 [Clostridia bacterium]|nr:hypothetical protein [Clostridia bacterium]
MKTKRQSGKKNHVIFRVVIAVAVAFALFKGVQMFMQLEAKQAELDALEQRKEIETIYNEEMADKVEDFDENDLEDEAREEGFVGPNDQVLQLVNN